MSEPRIRQDGPFRIREHPGFGHGLQDGETRDLNCPVCTREDGLSLTTRVAHEATYAPEDEGFLVTCPAGCSLGTSAHQPDEDGARKRIDLHRMATAPLTPEGIS